MEQQGRLYSDVVIIGAGLSGIGMACQLQRKLRFTDYVIYDRAAELGGAWAANKYPGCGVDIPGVLYSLSWFPNPKFSKLFPPQKEILAYIRRLALAYGIHQRTRLRIEWRGAEWMETSSTWLVQLYDLDTQRQFTHETKVLVSAVGGYTNPKFPDIPGLEDFTGPVVHTARWDKEYDLRGLNVAVIGNGCSGSQVVPAVLDSVQTLTHFIRTPQHYVPMTLGNHHFGERIQRLLAHIPFLLVLLRWITFWIFETALGQFYNDNHGKRSRKKSLCKSRKYITDNAPEQYWDFLMPKYEFGCRRRILDDQYIRSLHNPKMRIVNHGIRRIKPNAILTSSEEHKIDLIILATGFQFTQWKANTVIGRRGKSLQQHWNDAGGVGAYKTVAVNEFPNMFYLLGPNSGSGHTSVLFSIECAINLVIKVARPVIQKQAVTVEPRKEAEVSWCESIQSALRRTVLTQSCSNQHANPRSGWNFFSYPHSSVQFWVETYFPEQNDWAYR